MGKRGVEWKICDGVELDGLDNLGDCRDEIIKSALSGPFHEPDKVVLRDVATPTLTDMIERLAADMGVGSLKPDHGTLYQAVTGKARQFIAEHLTPLPALMETTGQDELRIVEVPTPGERISNGVILLGKTENDDEMIKGMMYRGTMVVSENQRRLGYGRGLVACQILSKATLPPWLDDTPTYNGPGAAVTQKGMRLAFKLAAPRLEQEAPDYGP